MNLLSLLTPKTMTFYATSKSSLRQVIEKMDYHRFSVIPIIDEDGKYVNSLSEGDILRYVKHQNRFDIEELENVNVEEIERHRPYEAARIDASFDELVQMSLNQNFIPIIDDRGIFIGIVRRSAVIKSLKEPEE